MGEHSARLENFSERNGAAAPKNRDCFIGHVQIKSNLLRLAYVGIFFIPVGKSTYAEQRKRLLIY